MNPMQVFPDESRVSGNIPSREAFYNSVPVLLFPFFVFSVLPCTVVLLCFGDRIAARFSW